MRWSRCDSVLLQPGELGVAAPASQRRRQRLVTVEVAPAAKGRLETQAPPSQHSAPYHRLSGTGGGATV